MSHLAAHGWSADDTVSLTQLISFLAFQLRVIHGLQVLAGREAAMDTPARAAGVTPDWPLHGDITTYPNLARPHRFVRHSLGWKAWVAPVPKAELTGVQLDSLIRPERADMAYFRLLARVLIHQPATQGTQ